MVIALELTKHANFVAFKIVSAGIAIFTARDVDFAEREMDLVPVQVTELGNPKGVALCHDHKKLVVAETVPVGGVFCSGA